MENVRVLHHGPPILTPPTPIRVNAPPPNVTNLTLLRIMSPYGARLCFVRLKEHQHSQGRRMRQVKDRASKRKVPATLFRFLCDFPFLRDAVLVSSPKGGAGGRGRGHARKINLSSINEHQR